MRNQLPTVAIRLSRGSHRSILKSINGTQPLKQAHSNIITSGLECNLLLSNTLINRYASYGLIFHAQRIFRQIPNKNVFSWTIMVSGLVGNGLFIDAVHGFGEMVKCGLFPNDVTVGTILPAIGNLRLKSTGKSVHGFWIRRGFEPNVVVETSLVGMYSQFECMSFARKVFDTMHERNVVSWNVIISGYALNGMGDEGIVLFRLMQKDGLKLDCFTIMSLLSASLSTTAVESVLWVHGLIIKAGFQKDMQVQAALINMYICKDFIDNAHKVFNEMVVEDVVTWTLMLKGFSSGRHLDKALDHLNRMMVEKIALDFIAFVTILSSCSKLGALRQGRRVHGLVVKLGFSNDAFVESSLIDMYATCGDLDNARNLFQWMEVKDVVCWNALISATGRNGVGNEAIDLFYQMKSSGVIPNESTLVSVLVACAHSGMVEKGLEIFNQMIESEDIVLNSQHISCIFDLLSRSGQLESAYTLVKKLPKGLHSSGVFGSLLSSSRAYNSIEMGSNSFKELTELGTVDPGHYSSLSNMHASLGNWKAVEMAHNLRTAEGLKKEPGWSLIEING